MMIAQIWRERPSLYRLFLTYPHPFSRYVASRKTLELQLGQTLLRPHERKQDFEDPLYLFFFF